MSLFHHFLRLETGTGREDWLVLSALAAAMTTFLGLWLSSGGGEQVTQRLHSVISDAVEEIGRDSAAETPPPAIPKENP